MSDPMTFPINEYRNRYDFSLELGVGWRGEIGDGNDLSGALIEARAGYVDFLGEEKKSGPFSAIHYRLTYGGNYGKSNNLFQLGFSTAYEFNTPFVTLGAGARLALRNDSKDDIYLSPGIAPLVSVGIFGNAVSVEGRLPYHPISDNTLVYETLLNFDLVPISAPILKWMVSGNSFD